MEPSNRRFIELRDDAALANYRRETVGMLAHVFSNTSEANPEIAVTVSKRGIEFSDPDKWRMACLVDRKMLYHALYHGTDSTKPLVLVNAFQQRQYIGIVAAPPFLEPGGMVTLGGSMKYLYNTELKSRGIQTPWRRTKRCWNCAARNSNSASLRVCEGCGVARFCSKHCQKVDWKGEHRYICKEVAHRYKDC